MIVQIDSMREYARVVRHVQSAGQPRSPRGRKTLDAGHVTVELTDPTQGWAAGTGRGVLPRIAAAEALQLMGAFADPELLTWASPNFAAYLDDDRFHGAYGRRVGDQVEQAVRKLEDDPDTRQAVITLWDPRLDNEPGLHDYPCTVALGFARQRDRLDMSVVMRSNDVWLGFPYDVFQFTQLQLTVARALDLRPGVYRHTAWSLHLYVEDVDRADEKLVDVVNAVPVWCPLGLGRATGLGTTSVRLAQRLARNLVYGFGPSAGPSRPLTESEVWYRDNVAGYVQRPSPSDLG